MIRNLHRHFLYTFLTFLTLLIHSPLEAAPAVCSIDPNGTYIEAEDFTGSSNLNGSPTSDNEFQVLYDPAANGGTALASGIGGYAASTPGNEVKEYTVNFPTTGTYYMWMRGKGFSNSEDSMFFRVDTDAWKAWNFGGTYNTYIWTDSMQEGPDNAINILVAGNHTLQIAMREDNAVIDGFYITKGTETPDDATVPSGKTSISPSKGCSGPFWTVDPGTIEPSNFAGYNAASLTFTITNTGTDGDGATASITSDQTWVTVDNNTVPALNVNAAHTVTVNFTTAALAAGLHTANLTITGAANNSPVTVPVNLLVKSVPSSAACGEIPLYAENLINPAIMVQLDTSGSMKNKMSIGGGVYMSRIAIAEDVLKEVFLDRSISWGFATWAGGNGNSSDSDDSPDYYTNYRVGVHEHDDDHQAALQAKADDGSPSGWTPLVPTMKGALEYFKANREDSHYNEKYSKLSCQPRILVLVTDGLGNTGTNNTKIDAAMDALINQGITVVAVGFGLSNASQLDRIVRKMQTAGEANDEDYLYHLHNEDADGVAEPFMAQNRQEFIDAMNSIVTNVKAQVFRGSSPAPTTSVDNGAILLNAEFDASGWTGNLTATTFNIFTGELNPTISWQTKNTVTTANINGFISDASGNISEYTDASISGDNYLCKAMGDIINSTPAIVGSPPFFYKFDSYFDFKYNEDIRTRDETAYFGANDGALHAVDITDGTEKWRFYPNSVRTEMAKAETSPKDDPCSSSYCHKFLVDGSPQPADVYVDSITKWRTILTTGLGEGGNAFFTLDITHGEDFDAAADIRSKFLWEFTDTDDAELGLATALPTTARIEDSGSGTRWATFFGSGAAQTDLLQADKEAYLFAVGSYDKSKVWEDAGNNEVYKIKLVSGTMKNDIPSSPLIIDTQKDDYISDRIYVGNLYGNLYRVKNIGFSGEPVVELFFESELTDHRSPVTARPGFGYAENNSVWIYFGTGRYQEHIDKFTTYQQYFYGLFDEEASENTAASYKKADLVQMETDVIEAYALDSDGEIVDLSNDGKIDEADLRKYRTVSCDSPDEDGKCNPDVKSWMLQLATPDSTGSERVISQPLIVGGVVFFATFIPDGDVCEGNGDTWLFALDWETGSPPQAEDSDSGHPSDSGSGSPGVFDINKDDKIDENDESVLDSTGKKRRIGGIYIGTGRPARKLTIYNDILYIGRPKEPPTPIKVNLRGLRTRLRSWQQQFN